jgi:hypothetical protein
VDGRSRHHQPNTSAICPAICRVGYPRIVVTRLDSLSLNKKADPLISYRPCQLAHDRLASRAFEADTNPGSREIEFLAGTRRVSAADAVCCQYVASTGIAASGRCPAGLPNKLAVDGEPAQTVNSAFPWQ